MSERGDEEPDPAASGALPTRPDTPPSRRAREATEPGTPSLSAFDPPRLRFEPRGELGRGGMGWVEDAYDRALGRQVAIKHILATDPVALARFEREARITARLEHPSIVPIHDAGRSADGTPFYVMRHVDGRPLDELVEDRPLTARLAQVPNVLAVCDAVAYAHARGVVHRDIKPTNILVGPFGETLLIDWGLAREIHETDGDTGAAPAVDPHLTRVGSVAGTPGFMAPEQARGEAVDARADVFALGATLFHVLAGRPPYSAASATEMIDAVGQDRPPDWSRIPRAVPADLVAIVHKAMASDAAARYPDAGAMALDLRQFVTGKLVAAHAYGRREQLWRFVRRNRGALAVAAVAVVLLGVLGIVSVRRVIDERDAADAARETAEARRRDAAVLRDRMLVDRATELARTDPLAAVALLRDLAPDSGLWPEAAAAAAAAFYRGIPSGFEIDPSPIRSLAVAPDDRRAIATSALGRVVEIDLVERTQRRVLQLSTPAWCDYVRKGQAIACRSSEPALWLVTLATDSVVKIPLPDVPESAVSDGDARLWFESHRKLYALDLSQPTLPPVVAADDCRDAAYVRDAQRLVTVGTDGVEIIGADRRWHLALPGVQPFVIGDGTRMAIAFSDRIEVWDLRREPTRAFSVPADQRTLPLGLIGDSVYAVSGLTLSVVPRHGVPNIVASPVGMYGTAPGRLVVAHPDGSVRILGPGTADRIGARPMSYERLAISADGRFLVGGTNQGNVVWFDLQALSPSAIAIDSSESLVALGKSLWTLRSGEGLARYPPGSPDGTVVVPALATTAGIDPLERFAAAGFADHMTLADLVTGTVVGTVSELDDWAVSARGLYIQRGRDLSIFEPPAYRERKILTLPEPAKGMQVRGEMVALHVGAQLCRWSEAAGLECGAVPGHGDLQSLAIEPGGQTWAVVDGSLFRWRRGRAWEPIALAQRVSGLASDEGRSIAYGGTSLVVLGDSPRSIAIPRAYNVQVAEDVAVYDMTSSMIGVTNLVTGATYEIPTRDHDEQQIFTDGHRIAYLPVGDRIIHVLELTVPTEPTALRAWLDRITNARRTHDGIVSFP